MQTNILFTGDIIYWWINNTREIIKFLNALFGSMQPVWAQHCESEAISQSLRAISAHRSSDVKRVTSPTNQRGKLKAVSHRKHMLTGAASVSVITHQLSLKGKAAADVAEVAKHLNITYDVRDAENAGGIAECSHIMEFTV